MSKYFSLYEQGSRENAASYIYRFIIFWTYECDNFCRIPYGWQSDASAHLIGHLEGKPYKAGQKVNYWSDREKEGDNWIFRHFRNYLWNTNYHPGIKDDIVRGENMKCYFQSSTCTVKISIDFDVQYCVLHIQCLLIKCFCLNKVIAIYCQLLLYVM